MEHRLPCPTRIVEDLGGAYGMGALGGGVWHYFQGMRNSPKGIGNRLRGGMSTMKLRAPALGGAFAAWGGTFAVFDCTLSFLRQTDDPINSITSGALTGAVLAFRSGPRAMMVSGIFGAGILAMIEGVTYNLSKFSENIHKPQLPTAPPRPVVPVARNQQQQQQQQQGGAEGQRAPERQASF